MQTMIIETYKYDELGDDAKEKAREWFREGALDYDWWEFIYEDSKECLNMLGFEIDNIQFSGFWSQGDGACFTGSWSASDVQSGKLREHAPQDQELHRIGSALRVIARGSKNGSATLTHTGHYSHEHSVTIDAGELRTMAQEEEFGDLARAAMKWIYGRLQAEYEYHMEDAQLAESIRSNEYDFTASGSRTAVL